MTESGTFKYIQRFGSVWGRIVRDWKGDAALNGNEQLITVAEVAEYLGVSPNTMRNWGLAGKVPEYRHPMNNYRLYKSSDLIDLRKALASPPRSQTSCGS